jgi:iron(III) transport system permease protein
VGRELREASAVAGSSNSGTYLRVVAPLVVPGLVAGWALLFVRMLGDLTASVMLAGPSTSVIGFRILSIYSNGSFGDLAALTLLVTVIATVVVFTLLLVSNRIGRRTRTATGSVVPVTGAEPGR